VELPSAVARGENEKVEFCCDRAHVEDNDVLATVFVGGAGSGERELQTALVTGFELRGGVGDGVVPFPDEKTCLLFFQFWVRPQFYRAVRGSASRAFSRDYGQLFL
jgi:hypothetical protein